MRVSILCGQGNVGENTKHGRAQTPTCKRVSRVSRVSGRGGTHLKKSFRLTVKSKESLRSWNPIPTNACCSKWKQESLSSKGVPGHKARVQGAQRAPSQRTRSSIVKAKDKITAAVCHRLHCRARILFNRAISKCLARLWVPNAHDNLLAPACHAQPSGEDGLLKIPVGGAMPLDGFSRWNGVNKTLR